MKVFLAGCEDVQFITLAKIAKHPAILFSYFHWLGTSDKSKGLTREISNEAGFEVLCDSGLFTLMFGVGKGGNYDLQYMRDYTTKYFGIAKQMGIAKMTIVESDVHKLLGMPAVFELRKYFEDCGLNVLYVWHKEEGIEGLMRMAERYSYIALSIPELRIILKGNDARYQTVTQQLLQQIRAHVGPDKIPKVHLLGNTVQETMQTSLAYSCDSTSWLAGGRFGRVMEFYDNRLRPISKRSPRYLAWERQVLPQFEPELEALVKAFGHNPRYLDYQKANLFSAMSYRQYQEYLDRSHPWIGLRNSRSKYV